MYSACCVAGVCIVGLGGEEGDVVMLRMSVVLFVKIQNTQEIDMKLFEAVCNMMCESLLPTEPVRNE